MESISIFVVVDNGILIAAFSNYEQASDFKQLESEYRGYPVDIIETNLY